MAPAEPPPPPPLLKIGVLGARRAGKTLLCMALAGQPLAPGDHAYAPTAALRIQEVLAPGVPTSAGAGAAREAVRAQLWDASLDPPAGAAAGGSGGGRGRDNEWAALADGADGLILALDAGARADDDGERELEALHARFARPAGLGERQCLVLALDARAADSGGGGGGSSGAGVGTPEWPGLRGRLARLPAARVSIDPSDPEAGAREARRLLEQLLAGAAFVFCGGGMDDVGKSRVRRLSAA